MIKKHLGCVRYVYNWALGLKIEHYKATKKGLFLAELSRQLVSKKKEEQFEWLNEVNSQSLQSALILPRLSRHKIVRLNEPEAQNLMVQRMQSHRKTIFIKHWIKKYFMYLKLF